MESIEAWAAKRAIQFAIELGITEAEFEGDSQTIVAALTTPQPCSAPYGLMIADAQTLSLQLHQATFLHVRRQGNSLAHALAHMAKDKDSLQVWMEDVSPNLHSFFSLSFRS